MVYAQYKQCLTCTTLTRALIIVQVGPYGPATLRYKQEKQKNLKKFEKFIVDETRNKHLGPFQWNVPSRSVLFLSTIVGTIAVLRNRISCLNETLLQGDRIAFGYYFQRQRVCGSFRLNSKKHQN